MDIINIKVLNSSWTTLFFFKYTQGNSIVCAIEYTTVLYFTFQYVITLNNEAN